MEMEFKRKVSNFFVNNHVGFFILILPILTKASMFNDLSDFAEELYHRLIGSEPEGTLVVSPFSLASLLILVRMGAENRSATEIDRRFQLTTRNFSVISNNFQTLLQNYERTDLFQMMNHILIVKDYMTVEKIDLTAAETFNVWPTLNICQRAEEFSFDREVELKLETETHFHNRFLYVFSSVSKHPFYITDDVYVNADTISLLAKLNYGSIDELDAKAIELPYNDGDTSLLIVSPNMRYSIMDLEEKVQSFCVGNLRSYLTPTYVELTIPKFKAPMDVASLKTDLELLGLRSIFIKLCDSSRTIKVSDVSFKVSFLVDEKHAGVIPPLGEDLNKSTKVEFRVDHPFMFFVKSSKNTIYLMGKFVY